MNLQEFREMPAFARHVAIAAWFIANPAPPAGYKSCRTCDRHMLAHDKHARCQKCRNAGGYLGQKYTLTCKQCGQDWVADKVTRRYCSVQCQHESQRRKA